jgi:hypothetical protein
MPMPAQDAPMTALLPRHRTQAPKVRAVVDALIKAFMPVPAWDGMLMQERLIEP